MSSILKGAVGLPLRWSSPLRGSVWAAQVGGNALPTDGSPTLILDFVGSDYTLDLLFGVESYAVFRSDPVMGGQGSIKVWI